MVRILQIGPPTADKIATRLKPYSEVLGCDSRALETDALLFPSDGSVSHLFPVDSRAILSVLGHALTHFGEGTVKTYRSSRLDYFKDAERVHPGVYRPFHGDIALRVVTSAGRSWTFTFGGTAGYTAIIPMPFLAYQDYIKGRLSQFQFGFANSDSRGSSREDGFGASIMTPSECAEIGIRYLYVQAATDLRALLYRETGNDGRRTLMRNNDVNWVGGDFCSTEGLGRFPSVLMKQLVPHMAYILKESSHVSDDLDKIKIVFEVTSLFGRDLVDTLRPAVELVGRSLDRNLIYQIDLVRRDVREQLAVRSFLGAVSQLLS